MKKRNGFVSNSSSSSFIIGVEKDSQEEFLVNTMSDAMNSCEDSCDKIDTSSKKSIINYFRDVYLWPSATDEDVLSEFSDQIDVLLNIDQPEKVIYEVSVDYNNEMAYSMINGKLKDCILIDLN